MQNRYLMDKAMRDSRRGMSRDRGYDYRRMDRTPYGSQHDQRNDYRSDYRGMDSHMPIYPNGTVVEGYGYGNFYPMDDRRRNDYSYSSDYHEKENEYKEDIKEWVDKLKRKVKFNVGFDQVIEMARSHDVKFKEFTELEFYAVFLAMASDYPTVASDPKTAVIMAKDFFEDDDIKVSPSEKLCIYLYKIVKGEE